MLTDQEKLDIRAALAGIARTLPNYRERRAQLAMMGAVAKALDAGSARGTDPGAERIAVVEAATGTGKSHAVVPALVLARHRRKALVLSSSTVALQDQLLHKDLPTLRKAMPFDFTVAVAKGRGRYVCVDRLLDRAAEATEEERQANVVPLRLDTSTDTRTVERLATEFTQGRWNGEFDSVTEQVTDDLWESITTDRYGCAGRKCAEYARCPYYAAREQIKRADVIVSNHDLLLASLSIEDDALLPSPQEAFIIIDEAHTLAQRATQRFAVRHSVQAALTWIEPIDSLVEKAVDACGLDRQFITNAAVESERLATALADMRRALDSLPELQTRGTLRFKGPHLPTWAKRIGESIQAAASNLRQTLAGCKDAVGAADGLDAKVATRLASKLGMPLGKLNEMVEAWRVLLAAEERTPAARWVERYHGRSGQEDYALCAAPLSAADGLHRVLWSRVCGAAALSATLTACGSFQLFLEETGLDRGGHARLMKLPSPFDYPTRATLLVPPLASDPRDHETHTGEIVALMPSLLTSSGTLVLFSSTRQMRETYASLPPATQQLVLMQGAVSKREIVCRHKARIEAGDRSVIFGLSSLAEGVDFPGRLLTHVIVAKLPFPVPDNPLEQARAEWIEAQGRSSFEEFTLPATGIKLAQAVGRLLRRETDHGTVTVLDRRLSQTRWGRRLLTGLPPFRLVVDESAWRGWLPIDAEEAGVEEIRQAA